VSTAVLSIRVPRKLKEEMEALKNHVDWRREITAFLEQRVKYYKKRLALQKIHEVLEKHPELPRGSAASALRRDRDSH